MNAGLPPPRWRRFGPAAALTAAALALLLPGLGRYGLWEPWELRLADQAAALAGVRPGSGAIGAASQTWLPALGIRMFGFSEAAARLPGVLVAVGTLFAVAWAAAGLYGRRAAAIAAVALMAMPLYLLQARQLTSDMPLLLASALVLGGLGRLGSEGHGSLVGLVAALAGLGLGALSGGVLVGVVAPSLAFVAAWRLSGLRFQSRFRRTLALAIGAGGLVLALAIALTPYRSGQTSLLLGGVPVFGPSTRTFEAVLRVLGFGLFPWGALALFALLGPLVALAEETAPAQQGGQSAGQSFLALLPMFVGAFGLAAATLQLHLCGQARISILPAVAVALARLLTDPPGRSNRLLAFLAAIGTLLVMRDLWLSPEELVSVHLSSKVTWPPGLSIRPLVAAAGVLFAAALLARFALDPPAEASGRLARGIVLARRWSLPVLLGAGVVLSVGLAHAVVPALSRHLSQKALLDAFRSLGGRTLALYRIPEASRATFAGRDGTELVEVASIPDLADRFRSHPDLFALIPRPDLAAVDDAFAGASVEYAVADASSSRFLLLAARLPAGHADQNPLAKQRFRSQVAATPPWTPRLQASATYGDAVQLYGADFPASVRRPGSFPLVLYFRTLRRPPSGYKIFVHVEGPGALVRGDHPPLDGTFPIERWRPGDLLRDQHQVEVPLMTTPAGLYTIFVGFWPGGDTVRRLPVTGGDHDGHNRVALGNIQIK